MTFQTPSPSNARGLRVARLNITPGGVLPPVSHSLRNRHGMICGSSNIRRLADLAFCAPPGGQDLSGNGTSNGGRNSQKDMKVLFAGLDMISEASRDRYSIFRGILLAHGYNSEQSNTLRGLEAKLRCPDKAPDVIFLGPHNTHNSSPVCQEQLFKKIQQLAPNTKVIYICPDTLSAAEVKRITKEYDPFDVLYYAAVDTDVILGKMNSVRLAHTPISTSPSEIVVCGFDGEKGANITHSDVMETMDLFAQDYDDHMRKTLHYEYIGSALATLGNFIGTRIIDAGCGTGAILGHYLVDVARVDFDSGQRPLTSILSIDASKEMIRQAKERYERYMDFILLSKDLKDPDKVRTIRRFLDLHYLPQDFMTLTKKDLAVRGFANADTMLASYFISWVSPNKLAAAMKTAELAHPGMRLITLEEVDQSITPSPHMKPELRRAIEQNIIPVESLGYYYDLLRQAGWVDIDGAEITLPIGTVQDQIRRDEEGKPPHNVRGKVFVMPK